MTDQQRLVANLKLALEAQADAPVRLIETHISLVLVAPDFAYKLKKAVRLDFLDFSTLEARRFYCDEELRLNRRLAPSLYLDVLPVCGTPDKPVLGGSGAALEYAVRMRAFEQEALWSRRIEAGLLGAGEIDQLAEKIADFHRSLPPAAPDSAWSTPAALHDIARDNFAPFAAIGGEPEARHHLAQLSAWLRSHRDRLDALLARRKRDGFVRECHGDLHSNNILSLKGKVEVFDCLEFDPGLRWIDVMNDIAFTVMDLQARGRPELAARLLDRYLERGGDFEGLAVLRYYLIERALVRGKVALLRARQMGGDPACAEEARAYLGLAAGYARPRACPVVITHGYSGSGKSVCAAQAVELLGAVRIRSDVERKRMHGLAATADGGAQPGAGIYGEAATNAVYRRLLQLARTVVKAGLPVIVDAAFLRRAQRREFQSLAAELGVPFFIFDLQAPPALLRERVAARRARGGDPSDAGLEVLELQIRTDEPLSSEEGNDALAIDAGAGASAVHAACAAVRAAMRS